MIKRDRTYDLLKAIGILLIMMGHLVFPSNRIITSFHVPLFFIVAGLFHRDVQSMADIITLTKKSAKRLLVPYFCTLLLLVAWGGIQSYAKGDLLLFINPLLTTMWLSNDTLATRWGVLDIGPIWFLWALFVARISFAFIQYLCDKCLSKYRCDIPLFVCLFVCFGRICVFSPYSTPYAM